MKKRNTGEVILAFFTGGTRRGAGLRCRVYTRYKSPIPSPGLILHTSPQSFVPFMNNDITQGRPALAKGTPHAESVDAHMVGHETPRSAGGVSDFMPCSIDERTHTLGSATSVEQSVDGYTVIHATIPI